MNDQLRRYSAVGLLFAIAGVLCFSLRPILIKLAYAWSQDPVTLLALRMAFAAPFFVGVAFWSGRSGANEPIGRRDFMLVIGLGLLSYYAASFLDFLALQYISAGLGRLVLFLYPTIVVVLSALFLARPMTARELVALLLTYAGLALVLLHTVSGKPQRLVSALHSRWRSSVCYAVYLVAGAQVIARVGSLRFSAYAMVAATIACLLQFVVLRPFDALVVPAQVFGYAAVMAIVSTVVPVFLTAEALRRVGANTVAIVGALGPVSTIFLGWLGLEEVMTPIQLARCRSRPRGCAGRQPEAGPITNGFTKGCYCSKDGPANVRSAGARFWPTFGASAFGPAVAPPSTTSVCPVMKPAASLARNKRRVCDVFRLPRARIRLTFREHLFDSGFVAAGESIEDRRRNTARCNAVHANAIAREFERGGACEIHDAGFGRAVRVQVRITFDAGDRRGGDDRTATGCAHRRNRVLDAEEHAAQAHGLRAIPILDGNSFQRPHCAADSGVVEDDVETTERARRTRDERCDVRFERNVGALKHALVAALRCELRNFFAARRVEIRDHDVGARVGKQNRRGAAHAACAAGDDRDLAFQVIHIDPLVLLDRMPNLARCGPRRHRRAVRPARQRGQTIARRNGTVVGREA